MPGQPRESEQEAARYRCFDVSAHPQGDGHVLIHSGQTGKSSVLPRFVAHLLFTCQTFKTLRNHAAQSFLETLQAAQQSVPQVGFDQAAVSSPADSRPEIDLIERRLMDFVRDGFLVSEAEIRDQILSLCRTAVLRAAQPDPITVIGIPTRNRTQSLGRAVTSYIRNVRRSGRETEFVVIDDSDDNDVCEANRLMLGGLRERHGTAIAYADRRQRARYADALARYAEAPPEIVHFALLGDERCRARYGAPRNAFLLHAMGAICLQVDDDTVCELAAAPEAAPGLVLSSENDASAYWFFSDQDPFPGSLSLVDVDYLGVHEQLLGKEVLPLVAAVQNPAVRLDIERISPEFLANMALPGARVAVTSSGTAGDSGAAGNSHRLFLEGPSFQRLTASESAYHARRSNRHVLRAPIHATIADSMFCSTMNLGMDLRTLLPPFMPVLRNEDGIFGGLLSLCFKNAFKGYAPEYALLHLPPEPRGPFPARVRMRPFYTNDLILRLLPGGDLNGERSNADRLAAAGRHLIGLAALAPADFERRLQSLCSQTIAASMQFAEHRLGACTGAPPFWIDDMRRYITSLQEAEKQTDYHVPPDLEGDRTERLALLQALTNRFGYLLIHWPHLVETALALRQQGCTLAGPL